MKCSVFKNGLEYIQDMLCGQFQKIVVTIEIKLKIYFLIFQHNLGLGQEILSDHFHSLEGEKLEIEITPRSPTKKVTLKKLIVDACIKKPSGTFNLFTYTYIHMSFLKS